MILDTDGMKPIYVQISEWLELEILQGNVGIDEKVYSQYQLAEMLNINPATAAKGLNLLADGDILYKKRGLGMFVATNAKELILQRRKSQTLKYLLVEVITEAKRLGLNEAELIDILKGIKHEGEEKL